MDGENHPLDQVLEEKIRPLMSKNSRNIFKQLLKSDKPLTTHDLQHLIHQQHHEKLSKNELNNWLTRMEAAGLVQRTGEKGKPVLVPYNKRFVFDLWEATEEGKRIWEGLCAALIQSPRPKRRETFRELEKRYLEAALLRALKEGDKSLRELAKSTGVSQSKILEFLEDHVEGSPSPLFRLEGGMARPLGGLLKGFIKASLTRRGVETSREGV